MSDTKRQWLIRILAGGLLGLAVCTLIGFVTQPGSLFGGTLSYDIRDFTFCFNSRVPEGLGTVLSLLLWFFLGAEVGVATLPFADSGRELVIRSLIHYAVTAATVSAWAVLNFWQEPFFALPTFLIPLTLVYLIVWLGRWVGWYTEVAAIREKLGLAPGPSALHWRETLPYVGFALLLCDVLPLLLRLFDPPDVPVLTGILLPFLLLPVGGFASGLSLGRRHGLCPLYPIVCGLFYLPTVFLLANSSALFHCAIVLAAALAGNLAGAARHKAKKGAAPHEKTDPAL